MLCFISKKKQNTCPPNTCAVFEMKATIIALFLILCCSFTSQAQSIIAVDAGSTYMKTVLIQPGKAFDIALSPDSKRKSFSGIAIVDGIRSYGSESFNVYGKKPAHVLWRVRELLGRLPDDVELQQMLGRHHLTMHKLSLDDNSTLVIDFAANTKDSKQSTPEEFFAMILRHCKDNAERHGTTKVSAIELTVPMFYNFHRRQALQDAVEISGMNLIGMVDENGAAVIQYAMDRSFVNLTQNVLFFNMGSSSTQVWDSTLGIEDVDVMLAQKFAQEFDDKHKHPTDKLAQSARGMVRLKKEGRSIKEILSGVDKFPASFQSLHRDIDFSTLVTRQQLELLSKEFFNRIALPVKRALSASGLGEKDLHVVETIGGGFRVPAVKEALSKALPDGMELVGCACSCNDNTNSTYRVRM
jgi:hypoxia up-regulated 1